MDLNHVFNKEISEKCLWNDEGVLMLEMTRNDERALEAVVIVLHSEKN